MKKVPPAWATDHQDVLSQLYVDANYGLTKEEAVSRYLKHGKNSLFHKEKTKVLTILERQTKGLIFTLLFIAALFSFLLNEYLEGAAILGVLLINTGIGFFTEYKAIRSMESLRKLGVTKTKVIRNGLITSINSIYLVPGDIVRFESGDIITADARIIIANNLTVDESTFSGESLPVNKTSKTIPLDTNLMERKNMLYKGTSVSTGNVNAVIVKTGAGTELGNISKIIHQVKDEETPLENRLNSFGKKLIYLTLIISVTIGVVGILSGKEPILMLKISIALAIAAIPEGLPIVATIALAKGMLMMAKKNALINKLSSVETLGTVSTIFTDKTGTLTKNKMTVEKYIFSPIPTKITNNIKIEDSKDLDLATKIGILCNDANISVEEGIGDPLEIALLKAGFLIGYKKKHFNKLYPRIFERPFNANNKIMATIHKHNNSSYFYAVKGAPEEVIKICNKVQINSHQRELTDLKKTWWLSENYRNAKQGNKIIGLAYKESHEFDKNELDELIFVGLVCLKDPPREEVKNAIKMCKQAGIKPVMVTGDHLGTALSIGTQIGMIDPETPDDDASYEGGNMSDPNKWDKQLYQKFKNIKIFSRVTPKQKLDLINFFQDQGEIVAMTGDGINDAPALRKANIGVAMGLRGTQIAIEASDIILKDDNFYTIITAILQGRVIFNNIKNFVIYLLSCNISEVLIITIATSIDLPLPLAPLQILFLNLVTDVFPALALGMGQGQDEYINQSPLKPTKDIVEKKEWKQIISYGAIITISTLLAFLLSLYYLKLSTKEAMSICFLTLGTAQVFHVFNMRAKNSSFLKNEITLNPHIWGAVSLCLFLLYGTSTNPYFAKILNIEITNNKSWLLILSFSVLPMILIQLSKSTKKNLNF